VVAEKTALLDSLAHRVIVPYVFIAATLIGLSLLIRFSSLPEVEEEDHGEVDSVDSLAKHEGKSSVFQYPNLMLGVLAIFLYVGAEVIAGDTLPGYGESLGIELSVAKKIFTSIYSCSYGGLVTFSAFCTIPKNYSAG
jgi:fucose permease